MNKRSVPPAHITAEVNRALARHIGRASGITAETLAAQLSIPSRTLRSCVSQLREEGVAICGHPSTGYFIAANAAELEATCDFLRTRAMHSLRTIAQLKRIPLPDLIGQLRLKT